MFYLQWGMMRVGGLAVPVALLAFSGAVRLEGSGLAEWGNHQLGRNSFVAVLLPVQTKKRMGGRRG